LAAAPSSASIWLRRGRRWCRRPASSWSQALAAHTRCPVLGRRQATLLSAQSTASTQLTHVDCQRPQSTVPKEARTRAALVVYKSRPDRSATSFQGAVGSAARRHCNS
jgi:hypothetical protein